MTDRLMTTTECAEYLGCTKRFLEDGRLKGTSPPYCKVGRLVRYRLSDVDAWLAANTRTSTSDPGNRATA